MKQGMTLALSVMLAVLAGVMALTPTDVSAVPAEAPAAGAGGDGLAADSVLHIAGASFVPDGSATVFLANSVGGVAVTGSSAAFMHAPVLLPDGVQVSGLTFYYYDNAPVYMCARLIRNHDPQVGSRSAWANACSPDGAVGYGNVTGVVSPTPIVIDNRRYNYEVEVFWSAGSSDLRLMSVSILYTKP